MATKKTAKRKPANKAKKRVSKVDKPYCGGTMSMSALMGFIRSALRNKFTRWAPKYACLADAKRPYKGPNKKQRFEYLCAITGKYFPQKEVEVDHIEPCGSLRTWDDIGPFARRLFCEKEGLRVVSKEAHKIITAEQRKKRNESP